MKPIPSYQHPQENPVGVMVHTLTGSGDSSNNFDLFLQQIRGHLFVVGIHADKMSNTSRAGTVVNGRRTVGGRL
jgi:hypothetical protein